MFNSGELRRDGRHAGYARVLPVVLRPVAGGLVRRVTRLPRAAESDVVVPCVQSFPNLDADQGVPLGFHGEISGHVAQECQECRPQYNLSYTRTMKTAISLPDDLFRQAETTAREMGISRSQLYAAALTAYVRRHRSADILKRINEVCDHQDTSLDPVVNRMQILSLDHES